MPGCEKNYSPLQLHNVNYMYYGPLFMLDHQIERVIGVFCHNCNPHHHIEHCELMLDSQNNIKAILIQIKYPSPKSFPLFLSNEDDVQNLSLYRAELIFNEILCSKKQYLTNTVNMSQTIFCSKSYYSIFSPVENKKLKIIYKINKYDRPALGSTFDREFTSSLKYGWNIFYDCEYIQADEWTFYTDTFKEIINVHCEKAQFEMFILYDQKTPPSLLNLCYSSLLQYNLNTALDTKKNILPRTLCERTPPCHFSHLTPIHVYPPNDCINDCSKFNTSSFIFQW